jgi:hypothetical protein
MTNQPDKTYNLTGADGKVYASATKGTLGGHRKSRIYGTLDCKGAARWIARGHYVKQRVFFADEATAIAAEFRPCANCLPEKYKEWKGSEN